ncbi:FG-GAP repeat domain-containing protein [Tunturiibacter gelidoferens]|uniref:Uncharacterized protein n=1 Tax=Tunturiibacter gelidiferens TaxID=3069689 RepID=A0ACC5P1M3_9BACT|nr:VCBS repeat-containing protein [Edaphobacter lichenicola]MBB5340488.1 hypothetical protein [Edaphobacter lichenicola]
MRPLWKSLSRTSAITLALLATLHAQAPTPTQTALTISPSTAGTNTAIVLTARVTSAGSPVHPGLVLFCNANAAHCEDAAILGTAQLTSAGTAKLHLRLSPNTYSLKAVFQGTPHSPVPRQPSTSATQSLTITGLSESSVGPVTATTASSGRSNLSAIVGGLGTSPLTGTVSFSDVVHNGTPLTLGTASINALPTKAQLSPFTLATYANSFLQVLSGDFNNDGLADLAALAYDDNNQDQNLGTSNLVTLLSNGDGTFRSTTVPLTTEFPPAFASGDFNGDGILDLAVYDAFSCSITSMLGNGDGTFTAQTPTSIPSCVGPPVLVADINGDGIPDLMLSGSQSFSNPAILLGKGDGTFTLTVPASSIITWPPTVLRDLNGDGIPDLITTSENYTSPGIYPILIYTGNGDGTFTLKSSIPYPHYVNSLDVADFNDDGIPDLIVANSDSTLVLLTGNGDGTFAPKAPISLSGATPYQIAAADFNGDGKQDVLIASTPTASNSTANLKILLGNGNGSFASPPISQNTLSYQGFTLGDYNGDGIPDVASLLYTNNLSTTVFTQLVEHTKQATIDNIPLQPDTDHVVTAHYSGSTDYKPSTSPRFDLITFPNVTANLHFTSTGFVYSRVTNTYSGTLTVTNTGTSAIPGPLQIGFTNLPATITLANPTVPKNEGFFTIPGGLLPGKSAQILVRFNNPFNAGITYTLVAYTGAF